MLRIPPQVLGACNKETVHGAVWRTTHDTEGVVDGFVVKMGLQHIYPERINGSGPLSINWTFNSQNEIINKHIEVKVPDYDPQDIAEAFINGDKVNWVHRYPKGRAMEIQARIGPNEIAHMFKWRVPHTLLPTLDEEMDLERTLIIPDDYDIPGDTKWSKGYSPTLKAPTGSIEMMTRQLLDECREHGLLHYQSLESLQQQGLGLDDAPRCVHCDLTMCLWETNKVSLKKDNQLMKGEATNKQKRFFAYKQMTFMIHGPLSKGDRRQLPECVVDGIRASWPEKDDTYTGFRESK
jgi:hypothetical protein